MKRGQSLADDPVFDAFVEDFIDRHGVPPSVGDIMLFVESCASVALDKGDGETQSVGEPVA